MYVYKIFSLIYICDEYVKYFFFSLFFIFIPDKNPTNNKKMEFIFYPLDCIFAFTSFFLTIS